MGVSVGMRKLVLTGASAIAALATDYIVVGGPQPLPRASAAASPPPPTRPVHCIEERDDGGAASPGVPATVVAACGATARVVTRVPLVRSIYSILKQVVETIASNDSSSFKEAVLVEYPGKGLWVLGFVTSRAPDTEIAGQIEGVVGVFVPSSPNPAMGQLVYVTPERIRPLDMPVEKAAKLVISFGMRSAEPVDTTTKI